MNVKVSAANRRFRRFRAAAGVAAAAFFVSVMLFAWLQSSGGFVAAPDGLQGAFALAWGAFLLACGCCVVLALRIGIAYASSGESPGSAALAGVLRRLIIGVVVPNLLLVVFLAVLVAGARGEAPRYRAMFVAFASLVGVPAVALAGCWALFRPWAGAWPLLRAGLVLPAGYGTLALLVVTGNGEFVLAGAEALLRPLAPMLSFNVSVGDVTAGLAFAAALFPCLVGLAVLRERRRTSESRSSG